VAGEKEKSRHGVTQLKGTASRAKRHLPHCEMDFSLEASYRGISMPLQLPKFLQVFLRQSLLHQSPKTFSIIKPRSLSAAPGFPHGIEKFLPKRQIKRLT
jgi:hypothetical protein